MVHLRYKYRRVPYVAVAVQGFQPLGQISPRGSSGNGLNPLRRKRYMAIETALFSAFSVVLRDFWASVCGTGVVHVVRLRAVRAFVKVSSLLASAQ